MSGLTGRPRRPARRAPASPPERETEVVLEVAEAVSAARCTGLSNAGEPLGEDTARAMWLG